MHERLKELSTHFWPSTRIFWGTHARRACAGPAPLLFPPCAVARARAGATLDLRAQTTPGKLR
eukprot:scaffold37355_cov78-Phaeocystis_antarctica.AAC.4